MQHHHHPRIDQHQWGPGDYVADPEVWFGSLEDVDPTQPVLVSNEDGTYSFYRRRADGTLFSPELED